MHELALFAGAGGGILGGLLLGWRTVCAVELDAYCRSVLLARQRDGILPAFPIWDDVRTFDGRPWRGRIDVISGGFPCQDISAAGKGAGIDGAKSGLWSEYARIIGEVGPRYVFVENSPMLTSRGIGRVLGDLASLGYDAQWGVLGANDVGSCHKRDRLWLIASDPNEERPVGLSVQGGIPIPTTTPEREFGRVFDATIPSLDHTKRLRDVADVAGWMERFAAIGNGQVPAVVRLAWQTLGGSMTPPPTPCLTADVGTTPAVDNRFAMGASGKPADG